MSKLIAIFTVFAILTGTCCAGALSALAGAPHHLPAETAFSDTANAVFKQNASGHQHHGNHGEDHSGMAQHSDNPCDCGGDCIDQAIVKTNNETSVVAGNSQRRQPQAIAAVVFVPGIRACVARHSPYINPAHCVLLPSALDVSRRLRL